MTKRAETPMLPGWAATRRPVFGEPSNRLAAPPQTTAPVLELAVQVVGEAGQRERQRAGGQRSLRLCDVCWQQIEPLDGEAVVGGLGHLPACAQAGPDAWIYPGRWLYQEPGWNYPVAICGACHEEIAAAEDENLTTLPFDDWKREAILFGSHEHRACWFCQAALPAPVRPDGRQ